MSLTDHARRELSAAGLFDSDSDYGGLLGNAVMELVETFSAQGHSGFSAGLAIDLFTRLANWEPLGPLTNDPAEWNHIAENKAGQPDLWQSTRNPGAFSNDGGQTYYLPSERDATSDGVTPLHTAVTP